MQDQLLTGLYRHVNGAPASLTVGACSCPREKPWRPGETVEPPYSYQDTIVANGRRFCKRCALEVR